MRTYADILASYEEWSDEPRPLPKGWTQRRGYAFERMLKALFALEHLEPKTNYRPAGEEIDGSLFVDGRTYLLEAKWWRLALPASQLYAFKGKVDGKLAGTLGIVISHSGYADDAVDALVSGKGVNMILFEATDLKAILSEQVSFTDALRQKLRYAAEYGQPFTPITLSAARPAASRTANEVTQVPEQKEVDVVVEGPGDEAGLGELLRTFSPKLAARVAIWPALGRSNLVSLSQQLAQQGHTDVTIFVDADKLEPARVAEISEAAQDSGANLIVFTPSFIDVLERACDTEYYNAVPETSIRTKHARRMARHTNRDRLWQASPALRDWLELRAGS